MDFSWSPEQLELKSSVAEFARRELNEDVVREDRECTFSRSKWEKCADHGLFRLAIPRDCGGDGSDLLTAMLMMEGLGLGCRENGLVFGINGQLCIKMPILYTGTPAQKTKYLTALCNGESIGAFAFTEPESGSDIFATQTRAEKKSDGYVLNGLKKFVTFAPIADVALVLATIDESLGQWGLTAFLVDTKSPGCNVGPSREKMGLRTTPLGELEFEDCFVPTENRLGAEGGGMSVLNCALEWERCCALAGQLGAMERQLEDCIQYARTRHQFGRPIGSFQSVANRIVDMKLRLESSRLMLYRAAWLKKDGRSNMTEAAMCKLYLSECFVQSGLDAIRIHGGKGYMTEAGVERDLRDAIGGTLYGGTSDIQRNIIARMLGL